MMVNCGTAKLNNALGNKFLKSTEENPNAKNKNLNLIN